MKILNFAPTQSTPVQANAMTGGFLQDVKVLIFPKATNQRKFFEIFISIRKWRK